MGTLYQLEVYRGVFELGFGFLSSQYGVQAEIMPVLYTYVHVLTHWSNVCPFYIAFFPINTLSLNDLLFDKLFQIALSIIEFDRSV